MWLNVFTSCLLVSSFRLTSVKKKNRFLFDKRLSWQFGAQGGRRALTEVQFWVDDPLWSHTFTRRSRSHPVFSLSFLFYNLDPHSTTPISPSSSLLLHELFRGPPSSVLLTCHSMFYSHFSQTDLPSSAPHPPPASKASESDLLAGLSLTRTSPP